MLHFVPVLTMLVQVSLPGTHNMETERWPLVAGGGPLGPSANSENSRLLAVQATERPHSKLGERVLSFQDRACW